MAMLKVGEFINLSMKYTSMPRKGWINKGSRKKENETIEVSRKEVCQALDDASAARLGFDKMMFNSNFYEKLLMALAQQEDDAIECDECTGVFRESWFNGKCPYCQVTHEGVIAIEVNN